MLNFIKQIRVIKKILKLVQGIGWFQDSEGLSLFTFAKNGPGQGVILEIGSLMGKSAIWLAQGTELVNREEVYTIDIHQQIPRTYAGCYIPRNTFEKLLENIKKAEVDKAVIPIVGNSHDSKIINKWDKPIRFLFIDGSHEYEDVKLDFLMWEPYVVKGGIIAFHDSASKEAEIHNGPTKVINNYILGSTKYKILRVVNSITYIQKIEGLNKAELFINNFLIYRLKILDFITSLILPTTIEEIKGKFGIFFKKYFPKIYFLIKK